MTESLEQPVHLAQGKAFELLNQLLALIRDEKDDRGLVLSLSAFAEDCLGRVLMLYLRDVKASKQLLNGFNAPLGPFSVRLKAAHALGLLADVQYRDLDTAREIRNAFAHTWEEVSFEMQSIKDKTANMSGGRLQPRQERTPREKFRATVVGALVELELLHDQLVRTGIRLPLNTFIFPEPGLLAPAPAPAPAPVPAPESGSHSE